MYDFHHFLSTWNLTVVDPFIYLLKCTSLSSRKYLECANCHECFLSFCVSFDSFLVHHQCFLRFVFYCIWLSKTWSKLLSLWCFSWWECRVHCAESGEESTEKESVYSLKCHISQEVNHLHEGLKRVSHFWIVCTKEIFSRNTFYFLLKVVNFSFLKLRGALLRYFRAYSILIEIPKVLTKI